MEIVTYHTDGLHIAIRHGKQPLSGESHLGLSLSKLGLLVAFALEFAPEGRRWQVAIRGSNGHEVGQVGTRDGVEMRLTLEKGAWPIRYGIKT